MAGGYGSKKNGVRIGVFWDGIILSSDGSQARITDAHINIDRDQNIVDSTNNLSWGGSAVTNGSDANINVSGSGAERIKSCSETWVTLDYGSTKTVTFTASMSGVDYAGGTLSVSKSITLPARAVDPPAAPSAFTATLDMPNAQATLAWTNNPTTNAPYEYIEIERTSNGGVTWVAFGVIPGSLNSFTDTGLAVNSRYRWRIRATNASGDSVYVESADVITTPTAPSNCAATKNADGTITVTWVDNSLYETGFEILHAANGTWDGTAIATVAANTTSWTHTAPSTSVTHKYKVRAKAGSLASDYSSESNSIQLIAPPLAPTNLSPSSGAPINGSLSKRMTWKHNPVDSSPQTAYELAYSYSTDGGVSYSTDTTVSGTTTEYRDFAAATFTNGRLYRWRVRTKGADASFGPWSGYETFVTSAPPTGAWTTPMSGGVINTTKFTGAFTYSDPEAKAQSRYKAQLLDENHNVIEELDVPTNATTVPWTSTLTDGATYYARLWLWDADGMQSSMIEATFTADFPVPMPAIFGDLVWDNPSGSVLVQWDSQDPADGPVGTPATVSNTLIKSEDGGATWEEVATNLPNNSSYIDWTVALNTEVIYRIISYSSTPTSNTSDDATVITENRGQWIFISGGPGFARYAKMRIDPDYEEDYERPKTVYQFAGRDDGVEVIGTTRDRDMAVSAILEPEQYNYNESAARAAIIAVADLPAPILYRDTRGRKWYCSIGRVKFKTKGLTTVSFPLTWVGKNVG